MILKRILFLFTSVALLAGCSSGRAPEIRAICLRDDIGNYIIKWETAPHTDGTMKLYVSDTPNSFDMSRPCSYADINDGRVTYITNDNITRKYFLLSFNDKYYRTVGARSVQMDSVQNLRDIGGYFSEHGNRMTGWGKIFLSGELKALSRNDTIRLDNLKIKTVIDLRGEDEIALACPQLHLVEEHLAVDGLGSAVDIQNSRIAFGRVIADRLDHPAVQLHAAPVAHKHGQQCSGATVRLAKNSSLKWVSCCSPLPSSRQRYSSCKPFSRMATYKKVPSK